MSDVSMNSAAVINVAVMNQRPNSDVNAQSPLAHISELQTGLGHDGIRLQEKALLGHLVIRGSVENEQFTQAVANVLGADLPSRLQSVHLGALSIRWISPDEWLVICDGNETFALENKLREAAEGHFAIVNVSGGQTVLIISGTHAREVLMKSTPYDIHDNNFPIGKVVSTVLSKSQAVICRTGDTTWELVIRRSFSDYIWLWLQDACGEFGLMGKGN